MMFEQGIRGRGITHIAKKYEEANNKYMRDYDSNRPSKYIQYLDANNLYGCAMSRKLPAHGFKWLKDLTVEKTKELITKKRKNRGFVFEVDLEYPEELWGLHNDYPLAPEKIKKGNAEKLIGSFYPKKNYVIHYKNLKQYLNLGMKVTAVHGGIAFQESY